MAILAFQKPDKVIMVSATDTSGQFEFRPLEPVMHLGGYCFLPLKVMQSLQ